MLSSLSKYKVKNQMIGLFVNSKNINLKVIN
jgi:hypothetical protein